MSPSQQSSPECGEDKGDCGGPQETTPPTSSANHQWCCSRAARSSGSAPLRSRKKRMLLSVPRHRVQMFTSSEHFSIAPIRTANGNDFASTLRQSKVGKRKGIGGCRTVDQGREDGGATRR
ncbi:unnamed protein product [Tetraodon nigroviridis]|uniref:(spotted green pufferfish) hypothetical protein n=1 Tax=Tetraodon nigroviridis TaxID=99883 RepID=Q4T2I0_TETNG|nr:unnamed protein product [Tetraodon nigroviridis]